MLNEKSTMRAIELIEELDAKVDLQTFKTKEFAVFKSSKDSLHLANLRDYFMFFAFEATKEEAQRYLSWDINQYVETEKYDLFFFVIDNILRLRYQIPSIPLENLSKDVFIESFNDTEKEFDLEEL